MAKKLTEELIARIKLAAAQLNGRIPYKEQEEIDTKLKSYEQGEPKHKPDVLKQTVEIQKQREEMKKQHEENINIQGKRLKIQDKVSNDEREATIGEVVHLYELANNQLNELNNKFKILTMQYEELKKKNMELENTNQELLGESVSLKAELLSHKS